MRQEQEPATEEITEVAPGVLRLQLPIAMPGLGHVNCYALEDERGVALVDPGLPGRTPGPRSTAGWPQAGFPLARVHTVDRHPQPPRPLRRGRAAAGRDRRRRRGPPRVPHLVGPAEPADVDVEAAPSETPTPAPTPWDAHAPWGGDVATRRDGR